MSLYVYQISHYIKESNFKCEAVIHIIARNMEKVVEVLEENEFNSDGITSIVRMEKVKEGTSFDQYPNSSNS